MKPVFLGDFDDAQDVASRFGISLNGEKILFAQCQ